MKTRTVIFTLLLAAVFVFGVSFQAIGGEGEEKARGETVTLTGQVDDEGLLITDDGQKFELGGDIASEVRDLSGQRIQVMGTVMEKSGQQHIEIEDYMVEEQKPEAEW